MVFRSAPSPLNWINFQPVEDESLFKWLETVLSPNEEQGVQVTKDSDQDSQATVDDNVATRRGSWTVVMENRLVQLVTNKKNNKMTWKNIADKINFEFGQAISIKACSTKYDRELNPELEKGPLSDVKKQAIKESLEKGEYFKKNKIQYREMTKKFKIPDHKIRQFLLYGSELETNPFFQNIRNLQNTRIASQRRIGVKDKRYIKQLLKESEYYTGTAEINYEALAQKTGRLVEKLKIHIHSNKRFYELTA